MLVIVVVCLFFVWFFCLFLLLFWVNQSNWFIVWLFKNCDAFVFGLLVGCNLLIGYNKMQCVCVCYVYVSGDGDCVNCGEETVWNVRTNGKIIGSRTILNSSSNC